MGGGSGGGSSGGGQLAMERLSSLGIPSRSERLSVSNLMGWGAALTGRAPSPGVPGQAPAWSASQQQRQPQQPMPPGGQERACSTTEQGAAQSDRLSGWEAVGRVSQLLLEGNASSRASSDRPPHGSGAKEAAVPSGGCGGGGGGGGGSGSNSGGALRSASDARHEGGLRFAGDLTLRDLMRAFELRNAYDWDEDLTAPREVRVIRACCDQRRPARLRVTVPAASTCLDAAGAESE